MSDKNKSTISRRRFLNSSILGAAGLTLLPLSFIQAAPSDTIRLGVIGLGQRAVSLTDNFLKIPGVRVVAGSDVYA